MKAPFFANKWLMMKDLVPNFPAEYEMGPVEGALDFDIVLTKTMFSKKID